MTDQIHPVRDLRSPADRSELLRGIVVELAQPDPTMVSKLDRGKGLKLDYVSHADTTIMLCTADPLWTYDYVRTPEGLMATRVSGANLVLEGWVTVHGVTRPCVGTCVKTKGEPEKELTGDLIRNGAMRFGIATKLWSKLDDVSDNNHMPAAKAAPAADRPMTDPEFDKFVAACEKAGIEPTALLETVRPGRDDMPMVSERPALLAEYTRLKNLAPTEAPPQSEEDVPAPVDPEPENTPETDAGPVIEDVLLASKAQVRKIQTMFGKLGIKDRDAKLSMVAEMLGIEKPASTNVLTLDQAHDLIEALEELARIRGTEAPNQ